MSGVREGAPRDVGGRGCAPRGWLLAAALLVSIHVPAAQAAPLQQGAAATTVPPTGTGARSSGTAADARTASNLALIRAAFDAWRAGTGGVFDLLAEDVEWTVAGDSPVSGVYTSRQDFLDRAVAPITARLATPIVPELQHVVAQGDAVVVLWRGSARPHDGGSYRNHYAWHMQMAEGRIVRVVAFLDTWALAGLMK